MRQSLKTIFFTVSNVEKIELDLLKKKNRKPLVKKKWGLKNYSGNVILAFIAGNGMIDCTPKN